MSDPRSAQVLENSVVVLDGPGVKSFLFLSEQFFAFADIEQIGWSNRPSKRGTAYREWVRLRISSFILLYRSMICSEVAEVQMVSFCLSPFTHKLFCL